MCKNWATTAALNNSILHSSTIWFAEKSIYLLYPASSRPHNDHCLNMANMGIISTLMPLYVNQPRYHVLPVLRIMTEEMRIKGLFLWQRLANAQLYVVLVTFLLWFTLFALWYIWCNLRGGSMIYVSSYS